MHASSLFGAVLALLLSARACTPSYSNNPGPSPGVVDPPSPAHFVVKMQLSSGDQPLFFNITREWAPLGADRFYSLVQDGHYNCAGFYRVIPGFIAQFGTAAEPAQSAKWRQAIPDDPVVQSNAQWSLTFATAGPRTRSMQLFVNYAHNKHLDREGFAPFGQLTAGFDTALAIHPFKNSGGPKQGAYMQRGNDYFLMQFPEATIIYRAEVVGS